MRHQVANFCVYQPPSGGRKTKQLRWSAANRSRSRWSGEAVPGFFARFTGALRFQAQRPAAGQPVLLANVRDKSRRFSHRRSRNTQTPAD